MMTKHGLFWMNGFHIQNVVHTHSTKFKYFTTFLKLNVYSVQLILSKYK